MNKTKCKICGKEIGNKGLTSHFKNTHNISSKEYYDKYLKQENEGKCLECGKETKFIKFTKGYHSFCSTKCSNNNKKVSELKKKSCIKKYGVDNPAKAEVVKDKIKQTNLERYGAENVYASKIIRAKIKESFIKRYGVDNPAKSNIVKQRVKETNLKRLGVENPSQSPKVQEKIKETNLKRYGTEYGLQNKDIKKKIKETHVKRYGGIGKQSPIIREKINKTCLKKYGVTCIFLTEKVKKLAHSKEAQQKSYDTKKKNHTFTSSKPEKELEIKLKELFPDLETQYKSELYPFACDFYIPSLDLYIEYNGTWTHGGHFFDENDEDDLKVLELWKSRNTEYYKIAINVWTKSDRLKLKTAIENNLNYIAWFNEEQAYDWIEKMRVG